ncbi:MAG: TIGR03759 family integrating conjugative element protein [Halomonas sp.]|nr:TIGR03759 family integrating conjugative element protein [Halomonas sp.]MCC5902696.1 TIGR03759 family integrating conjugative element protein [Halomonas sp.]
MKHIRLAIGVTMASMVTMVTAGTVLAQSSSVLQELSVNETGVNNSLRAEAREWGLNEQELERYEQLMEGSRGIWSPGLDPVTALGIEAETEQERRRYAEMLVEIEKARVERELAFQHAYDEAWARMYPDDMPIAPFLANDGHQSSSLFPETRQSSPRLSVHVAADDCTRCDQTIADLLSSGVSMDVFVIGTDGDDSKIRAWAREHSVPVSRVQSREITLNHGRVQPSLGVTIESVPQVFSQ